MRKSIKIVSICFVVVILALGWFYYEASNSPYGPPNPPISDQAICTIAKNDLEIYFVSCANNKTIMENSVFYIAKSNEDLDKYLGKKLRIKANFLMNKNNTDSITTTTQCIRDVCKSLFKDKTWKAYAIVIEAIKEL